jgi:CubicO group peptidase (beta-lactamase class C family)
MSYKTLYACLNFIFACLLVLNFQSLKAQDFSGLDAIIERQHKHFSGPMAVLVWKDTTIYQKLSGEDMTMNTQGPIGCASAWLTAALAMTFVEQGKIELDDPVSKYLPVYSTYAKSYLTIRHCLANVTGIEPEKEGIQKFFQKTKFQTLEDEVNSIAKREIKNNPGEVFYYNNYGSNIVGRVLEVVGKKGFERLMMDRIFRPLGMKRSTFASEFAVNPFSGATSTPADFLKFEVMLLKGGTVNGKKILSESSIQEMQKIQTGDAQNMFVPKQMEGYQYGLGNWIMNDDSRAVATSPSLKGGWAWVDMKRKYACLVFGETKDKEEKKEVYQPILDEVDDAVR